MRYLLSLIALCAPVLADELTVSTPITLAAYVQPDAPETIYVQPFNPALGTLHGVRIDVTLHETLDVRGENLAQGPATFSWRSVAGIRLTSTQGDMLFSEFFQPHENFVPLAQFDGVLDFDGPSGFTEELKGVAELFSVYATGRPSELQRFVGTRPRPFLAHRVGQNRAGADSGKGVHGITHRVGGRVRVTYSFQPAP